MISIITIISMVALVVIDQLSKVWAVQVLGQGHEIRIWQGVLHFHYLENEGAAWGIFGGKQLFLILFTSVIIIAMLYYLFKMPHVSENKGYRIALVLIISGAVGNLIDRAMFHYVRDFIYFKLIDFPIFNIADMLVVCGVILLMICVIIGDKKEKNEEVGK